MAADSTGAGPAPARAPVKSTCPYCGVGCGVLIDTRDGAGKTYVQHRMVEEAPDLWRWLQDGAHVYVCGDASRMAKDVDTTLRGIAMSEGRMDADAARDWIVALARQNRYQRDVY